MWKMEIIKFTHEVTMKNKWADRYIEPRTYLRLNK